MAPVANVRKICAFGHATPGQLVTDEGQRMRAQRELQRAVVLDHLTTVGQWAQFDIRLDTFGADGMVRAVGRGEQRQRRFAEPPHLPQALPTIGTKAMKGIAVRELLDRGALDARSPPYVFDALERGQLARTDDLRAVRVGQPADLAEPQPYGEVPPAIRLQRTVPAARVYARRANHDAVLARIADDLCGRVEAHRLRVHEARAEHVRVVMLHPRRRVGDLSERGGVALREAVRPEPLELAEGALGELTRITALDHAPDELFAEVRYASCEFERRHGAAQLISFCWREPRADDRDLHRLLLEQRHAERLFQHRA